MKAASPNSTYGYNFDYKVFDDWLKGNVASEHVHGKRSVEWKNNLI